MTKTPSKKYADGEYIVREGEAGECMYFVQSGEVEVVRRSGGREFYLAVLGSGEFFGEMALVEHDLRNASVRALGEAEVVTMDRNTFTNEMRQDPALAYQMLGRMEERARELSQRLRHIGGLLPDEAERVRAFGNAYPLALNKDEFLKLVKKDASAGLRMLEEMSANIREMDNRLVNVSVFNPE